MNKYSLYIILLSGLFASCKYDKEVVSPDFMVTASSLTDSVNTPITFTFTGDADIITFYSGEPGNTYANRNRMTAEGTPQLQFSTKRVYGDNPGVADSTLQLLVSTDFSGTYTKAGVQKATWKNLTDRAQFSTGANANFVPSGIVDLSDVTGKDSTGRDSAVYIAFRYHELQTSATKRAWYTQDFTVDNILADGSSVNVADKSVVFTAVQVKDSLRTWYVYATSTLMWGGPNTYPETEDWIITPALYLDRVRRDLGVIVKSSPTTLQRSYTFSGYDKPGTYTVVFEAIYANRWGSKKIVKEITITVQ
jgi:hypothetical protein